jgi:hypothetical protein
LVGTESLENWASRLADAARVGSDQTERVCQLCVETLPVTGAGVSIATAHGQLATVAASNDIAARIEDLQFTLGEGPCVGVLERGGPVFIDDLSDPPAEVAARWPAFVQGAVAAGAGAVFAFPLQIGAVRLGALDLYRDVPGPLATQHVGAASLAADVIAFSLPLGIAPGELVDDGAGRSAYRLEIHQAAGMVAVQLDITVSDALLRLRAHAYAEGRAISEVADDVVSRRLRFPNGNDR